MTATKSKIKADYIANLQATYPFYTEGSRPLQHANEAADQALAGKIELKGECWYAALRSNNLQKAITRRMLADLPD